jgi:hypothetical protein
VRRRGSHASLSFCSSVSTGVPQSSPLLTAWAFKRRSSTHNLQSTLNPQLVMPLLGQVRIPITAQVYEKHATPLQRFKSCALPVPRPPTPLSTHNKTPQWAQTPPHHPVPSAPLALEAPSPAPAKTCHHKSTTLLNVHLLAHLTSTFYTPTCITKLTIRKRLPLP